MKTSTESIAGGAAVPLFPLGRVVATPAALELLAGCGQTPTPWLARHATGDWGEVCAADAEANRMALAGGGRLLSAYRLPGGERLWIITEGDRSATTLLMPMEY